MWASWQLGRVALATGDCDGALASFCRAASSVDGTHDVTTARPVRVAGPAMQISELRRQQESHREAQGTLNRTEHEALNQLMAATRLPSVRNDEVFATDGWSRVPAPLKLPVLMQLGAPMPNARAGPLIRSRHALLPRRDAHSSGQVAPTVQDDRVCVDAVRSQHGYPSAAEEPASVAAPTVADRPPGPADRSATTAGGGTAHSSGELAVHLLGPLYVAIDDVAVEDWPSARCRSLFGYLLTHREPWPPREVLMEVFWPESSPEASRNSLNVAIHTLRRTLQTITDMPVVVHCGGVYRINRDLRLWLDVDEFDSRVKSGWRFENAGKSTRRRVTTSARESSTAVTSSRTIPTRTGPHSAASACVSPISTPSAA